MWSLYRDSENGKKIIEMFNSEVDDAYSGVEGLFEYAKKWGSMVEPKHASTWSFMFYTNFTANNQLGEENPTIDDFEKFVETFEIVESEMDDDGNISFYNDAKAVWIKRMTIGVSSRNYAGYANGNRQRSGRNDNIFERLDFQFSFDQAMQNAIAVKGAEVTRNTVRMMLKNWRRQGLIVQTDVGKYRKS